MSQEQIAVADVIDAFKSVGIEFETLPGGMWTVLIDSGREGGSGFKSFHEALVYVLQRLRREV